MRDGLGSMQSLLVLGGGSDIGLATARAMVADRTRTVVLAARKPERLEPAVHDLRGRGATRVEALEFDARDYERHPGFVDAVFERFGDLDVVLVAFGVLGDQEAAERDPQAALDVMATNFLGAVSVLIPVAGRMVQQGHGSIVVLSSVAGERARKSNFVYGASKAGLDAFAQGLGDRLAGTGVHVLVVRPGFVRTKMTAGRKPLPLSTTPQEVAGAVVQGLRRDAHTVWVPPALRVAMFGLRHLPRPVFRRIEV
ncbi:MAG: decaprenylphospho-beta-D-erythro-pentofuranosid-2-ulose 2-reductase [Actinomycetota bacterium]|nr:decaprenylphospho-beta-D-erythro-pentofuranosid-2-ulose 2-reductase [Actinomycetota bacterium]